MARRLRSHPQGPLHGKGRPSATRVVRYEVPPDGPEVHADAEYLLARALRDGVVTQWDDGRGLPWWEGPPGPRMRELTRAVLALVGR